MSLPAQKLETQRMLLPTTDEDRTVKLKDVKIGWRSRLVVWLMRKLLRPWLRWAIRGGDARIARVQLFLAGRVCKDSSGLELDCVVLGRAPGHFVGKLTETRKPAILYLHGGAFILPAVPESHVTFVSRMCRDLDAVGFVPDYRLAPANKFPAALDDCERAYEALLELGFHPSRIVIAGESAGGNLTLGVLQRIRRKGLPMPACAVPISPGTEMGRIHAPPSRILRMRRDPILPIGDLYRVSDMYVGAHDASDPELSPLYADCRGFPPMYLLASDNEILTDDTVLFARRAREHGVDVKFDVWPILPHAFPLFSAVIPEARQARTDIIAFMREHIAR
jgi:acetyl esterase/lipase